MKCSLGISNFLKEISSLSHSFFPSISLHWSLRKAFLSLHIILYNSSFKWEYPSFSPLLFSSLLFTAICKASSDNHFAFLHFFSMGHFIAEIIDHCEHGYISHIKKLHWLSYYPQFHIPKGYPYLESCFLITSWPCTSGWLHRTVPVTLSSILPLNSPSVEPHFYQPLQAPKLCICWGSQHSPSFTNRIRAGVQFSLVAQSCPTLQLHGLQQARLPCPSPTPGACSNSCPLSRWCHPTISSSVIPFSSHLQSFPASESFLMSWLFTSIGQSIGALASASVLPMNIQDLFPLGWTCWISL